MSAKITFVIISVSDRVNELNDLLYSIRQQRKFDSYDISLLFQDNLNVSDQIRTDIEIKNKFIYPERMGCSGARITLLKHIYTDYDFFINLDDDMLLLDVTDYSLCIEKCKEIDTGFVLTNWAKTKSLTEAKIPKMRNVFIPQVLVYNGGGMVYNQEIAKICKDIIVQNDNFDNAWSLSVYIKGYKNYAFKGSLAIHKVCGKGGMQSWMRDTKTVLTFEKLINYRIVKNPRGNGLDICIPLDSDLSPKAKLLHKQNNHLILKYGK